jgi:hypothetical protein
MSHKSLLHFDTVNATLASISNQTSSATTSNGYNCSFKLPTPMRNVKKLSLKSMEIPVTFYNIRTGSTTSLSWVSNGTSYSTTIAENFYTTISALITVVNAAMAAADPTHTPVIVATSGFYYLELSLTSGSTFYFNDTNLSRYILGFRSTDTYASGLVTASGNYNLSVDNYLNFSITNIPQQMTNVNGYTSTFKIPLNASNNSIYYYLEGFGFAQSVEIQDNNFILSQLVVSMKDRFNADINPMGGDYSFSLEIEYNI